MISSTRDSTESSYRFLPAGVAAAAPFAGMLGFTSPKLDPHFNRSIPRITLKELNRQARTGDIILTTTKGYGNNFKKLVFPFTGSEFYHSEPVIKLPKSRKAVGFSVESLKEVFKDSPELARLSPKALIRMMPSIKAERSERGSGVLLLRPEAKITPAQRKKLIKNILRQSSEPFNVNTAVKNWLHEIFVPKLPFFKSKNVICSGLVNDKKT